MGVIYLLSSIWMNNKPTSEFGLIRMMWRIMQISGGCLKGCFNILLDLHKWFFTSYNNPILCLLNVREQKSLSNPWSKADMKHWGLRKNWKEGLLNQTVLVVFKILTITCKALNKMAPSYICDLLQVLHPNRNLRSASRGLSLVEPNHQTQAYGARSFFVAAPTLGSIH